MAVNISWCIVCSFCLMAFVLCVPTKGHRTLETYFNPNCSVPECRETFNGSIANLVYVRAIGAEDYLHYIFSTIGIPSVIVIQTKALQHITLQVNWTKLMSKDENITNALTLTGVPTDILYSYGTVFTKLLEYNDTDDVADLNSYPLWNSTYRNNRPFTSFQWLYVQELNDSSTGFVFKSTVWQNGSESDSFDDSNQKAPSLSFTFRIFDKSDRESQIPHLQFSENSTQFDFTIDNMKACCLKSRFALEMAMMSDIDIPTQESFVVDETKSIDDEYSPGVFRIVNVNMRPKHQNKGGYLQWKPVCYQNLPRARKVATFVKKYELGDIHNVTDLLKKSVAYAFYGDQLFQKGVIKSSMNISFGLSQDGTYTKTNFTSWTATLGYGVPPADAVSILVIGIIAAGLGIPVVLIIFGGLFVFIKRRRQKHYRVLVDVSSSYPQVNS